MKTLLRSFLINLSALWVTTKLVEGFTFSGGLKTLVIGSFGIMIINIMVIPLLKIMFLPLNLLTLGFFTWVLNVIGLYFLTTIIPQIKITPYFFSGADIGLISLPAVELNVLQVAIVASLVIGFISHFLSWLSK